MAAHRHRGSEEHDPADARRRLAVEPQAQPLQRRRARTPDRRRRRKPTGVSNSARATDLDPHVLRRPPSRRARALRIRRQRFTRASMISDIWQYGTPQHEKRRMINSEAGMVTNHKSAQEDTSGVLVPDVREKLRRSGYTSPPSAGPFSRPSPGRRDTLRPRTSTLSSSARTRVWRWARSTRRSRYWKRSAS